MSEKSIRRRGVVRLPFFPARDPRADDADRFAIARPPDGVREHEHGSHQVRSGFKPRGDRGEYRSRAETAKIAEKRWHRPPSFSDDEKGKGVVGAIFSRRSLR